jgi:hypothetical protein
VDGIPRQIANHSGSWVTDPASINLGARGEPAAHLVAVLAAALRTNRDFPSRIVALAERGALAAWAKVSGEVLVVDIAHTWEELNVSRSIMVAMESRHWAPTHAGGGAQEIRTRRSARRPGGGSRRRVLGDLAEIRSTIRVDDHARKAREVA